MSIEINKDPFRPISPAVFSSNIASPTQFLDSSSQTPTQTPYPPWTPSPQFESDVIESVVKVSLESLDLANRTKSTSTHRPFDHLNLETNRDLNAVPLCPALEFIARRSVPKPPLRPINPPCPYKRLTPFTDEDIKISYKHILVTAAWETSNRTINTLCKRIDTLFHKYSGSKSKKHKAALGKEMKSTAKKRDLLIAEENKVKAIDERKRQPQQLLQMPQDQFLSITLPSDEPPISAPTQRPATLSGSITYTDPYEAKK